MKKILLSSVMIAAMSVFIQDSTGVSIFKDLFRGSSKGTNVNNDADKSKRVASDKRVFKRAAVNDKATEAEVSIADRGTPEVVITAIKEMQEKVEVYQNNHPDNQPAHCEGIVNYINSVCGGIARSKQIRTLNTQSNNLSRWLRMLNSSDSDNSDMYKLLREFEGFLNSIMGKFKGKQADLIRKLLQKLAVIDQREIQHQNDETPPPLPPRNSASNVDEEEETSPVLPPRTETVDVDEEEETSPPTPSAPVAPPAPPAPPAKQSEERSAMADNSASESAPTASSSRGDLLAEIRKGKRLRSIAKSGEKSETKASNSAATRSPNEEAMPEASTSRGDLLAEIRKGKKLRSISKSREENETKTGTKNNGESSNMMEELMRKMGTRRQSMREDETDDDDGEW